MTLAEHYLKFESMLLELRGLEYRVPFITDTSVVEIESSGTPRILVKAEDGSIDKLITDEQLKRVSFDETGAVNHFWSDE